MQETLFHSFFLIFTGAAIIACIALFTRQPLLVAYVLLGIVLGPHGTAVITNINLLSEISQIGIIFLLFLLGLDMQPKALFAVMREATSVAVVSSALFAVMGYGLGYVFGFSHLDNLIIGMAMMFSSTIIGIKLLPTTVLHHRHAGELMVGLLLLQDFIAILCLTVLISGDMGRVDLNQLLKTLVALPVIGFFAFVFVKYILLKVIHKFDRIHEFIFLVAIGWCLGLASLCEAFGLSAEIGAFIAGITLATSPISQYIALNLKPLRDFFLILFFFSVGAQFPLHLISDIIVAAVVVALAVLILKPVIFRFLLARQSEKRQLAWSIGFRLGQISEFSLLIVYFAINGALLSEKASALIQATAIITFIVSSYIVVLYFPTPIAVKDDLRRD